MTGDLRQVPLGARTVSVQLRAELARTAQTPAEWELGEHVVRHPRDDYVRQHAHRFKMWKRVADEQPPGMIPKRLQRLFLRLFIRRGKKLRNSRRSSSQQAGQSIVIDFQMI